jgi:hypothetical protein
MVGLLCTGLICWFWKKLQRIPSANTLFTAFFFLLTGWTLTILEGLFLKDLLNLLEHTCYAISSVSLALWTWRVFAAKGVKQ